MARAYRPASPYSQQGCYSTSLARGTLSRKPSSSRADRFIGERPQGIRKEARPPRRSARLQQHRTSQSIQGLLSTPENNRPDSQVSSPFLLYRVPSL